MSSMKVKGVDWRGEERKGRALGRPTFEDDIYSAKGGQKSMSIINSTEYSIIRRNIRCVITENLNAKSTSVTAL